MGIDADHVAGLDPAVRGEAVDTQAAVVAGRDPGPTDLEFTNGGVIPFDELARVIAGADLEQWAGNALAHPVIVLLVGVAHGRGDDAALDTRGGGRYRSPSGSPLVAWEVSSWSRGTAKR